MLGAGTLFTWSVVGTDPAPHRAGRPLRAGVLVAAMAAHGVLAMSLYAYPPAGVPAAEARLGGLLLWYGGGLVELAVVTVFCGQWYAAAGRVIARSGAADRPPPASPRRRPAGRARPAR